MRPGNWNGTKLREGSLGRRELHFRNLNVTVEKIEILLRRRFNHIIMIMIYWSFKFRDSLSVNFFFLKANSRI